MLGATHGQDGFFNTLSGLGKNLIFIKRARKNRPTLLTHVCRDWMDAAVKMLILRTGAPNAKKTKACVPIVRTKTCKYGSVLDEHWLSIRRDVMLTGANAAGKTRWLMRLYASADQIWRRQPTILLRAINPVGAWAGDPRVIAFMQEKSQTSWSKIKCWERSEWLIKWVEATNAVVMLDDAHLLTGRKLDIAKRLTVVAGRIVSGASQASRIPINLRMSLLERDPHIEALKSDAAYDMTSMFMWLVILCCLFAGAWQLAAVLGGMKMLGRGNRAAKQT